MRLKAFSNAFPNFSVFFCYNNAVKFCANRKTMAKPLFKEEEPRAGVGEERSKIDGGKAMTKHKKYRVNLLSVVLALAMVAALIPGTVFAVEAQGAPECHPVHDEACGYQAPIEGASCAHLDEENTYTCVPAEAGEEYACLHDDECGFAEAVAGAASAHSCGLCAATESSEAENSSSEAANAGEAEQQPEPLCDCTVKCIAQKADAEAAINAQCPVCGIADADLASCVGEAPATLALTQNRSGEITEGLDFTDVATPASGAGYSWDSSSLTLTLSGIQINVSTTEQYKYGIMLPEGSTVVAQAGTTNVIRFNAENNYGSAIRSKGTDATKSLTFTGSGELEIYAEGFWTYGITTAAYADAAGGIIVEDMPNFKIDATVSGNVQGLHARGQVVIKNSAVTIATNGDCILAVPLAIENSTVNLTSSNAAIASCGNALVKDSTLTMSAVTYAWQLGVMDGGVATIDNSEVTATITSTTESTFYEWRKNAADGFIFKNNSVIKAYGGKEAVKVNGSAFITFGNSDFYYNDVKITDYKTNAAFVAGTINVMADYAAVDAAIAKAETLTEDDYKDFSAVTDAIAAVVREKYDTEQDAVDAMATAIEDTIDALEYKDADYTKVDAAITKAQALNKDHYKDFSAVTTAITNVVRGKNITEQSIVDGYTTAIEDAIKNLEKETKPVVTDPDSGMKLEYENGDPFDIDVVLSVTTKSQADMDQFQDKIEKSAPGLVLGELYDVKLLKDGEAIQPSGKMKVSIPLTEKMKAMTDLKVVYIDDASNVTVIPSEMKDGFMTFVTDHFSYYYGLIGKSAATPTPTATPIATPSPTVQPTASPTAAPTVAPTAKPTEKPGPATGDSSNSLLYIVLFVLSAGSLITLLTKKSMAKHMKK